jgi:arylsulfatase A-like enzyme
MPADRPNILLLVADQHRPDVLGCVGDEVARTPNLDRLADRGVVFEEAYTTSPLCGPARSSLASGVYPHDNDCVWGSLEPDDWTFFRALRDAGYHTAHVGKQDHSHSPEADLRANESLMHDLGFETVRETDGTGPGDLSPGCLVVERAVRDH